MKFVLIRLDPNQPSRAGPLLSVVRRLFPECEVRVMLAESEILRIPANREEQHEEYHGAHSAG